MNHSNNPFYKALELKYIADAADAEAKVLLYFSQPMGVADHSDVSKEIDAQLGKLASAKEKLQFLRTTFAVPVQSMADVAKNSTKDGIKEASVDSPIKSSTENKK